jgi:hypothetical protein
VRGDTHIRAKRRGGQKRSNDGRLDGEGAREKRDDANYGSACECVQQRRRRPFYTHIIYAYSTFTLHIHIYNACAFAFVLYTYIILYVFPGCAYIHTYIYIHRRTV